MSLPVFTELNAETGAAYAHALALSFGLTVVRRVDPVETDQEYLLSDGSIAGVWLEFGHVYGEV